MKLTPLCPAEDVWEGAIRQAVLPGGQKLALYQIEGEFFATDDTCTHGAASLSEDGCVVGDKVECSWHNGQFEIRRWPEALAPSSAVVAVAVVPPPPESFDPQAARNDGPRTRAAAAAPPRPRNRRRDVRLAASRAARSWGSNSSLEAMPALPFVGGIGGRVGSMLRVGQESSSISSRSSVVGMSAAGSTSRQGMRTARA